ncbi:MAG: helix-turn-helix domain-containing protein [Chloroflexi bacterium]|nr:helix-turn-helix domain-containing protein [Chloroflexota bacterium]
MMKNNLTNSMLTVREVSQILHVHSNTLRRWSDLGLIKAYRIGPRGDRRFKLEDITLMLLEESKGIPTNVNESMTIDKTDEYMMSR